MEWSSEQARAITAALPLVTKREAGGVRFDVGQTGDHALVYALLRSLNQAPRYEDFLSGLDEPSYEPSDRLLFRFNQTLVGHVQILHRSAWFHGVKLPIAGLVDFAVLPEWQQSGHAELLLQNAEGAMRKGGAVIGLVETDQHRLFEAAGWRAVSAQGYSQVSVQELLAHLTAKSHPAGRSQGNVGGSGRYIANGADNAHPIFARPWRQIEHRQVRAIYDAFAATCWGALARTDSYWHWLVGHNIGCEIIVAANRLANADNEQSPSTLAGYAVVQGGGILEVAALAAETSEQTAMLIHACQDAVELGHHTLTLHVPVSDPLHELVVTAGGTWRGSESGRKCLVAKLFDPHRWIEAIFPILRHRARAAGVRLPIEIVFDTGESRLLVAVTRRGSRLSAAGDGHVDVRCSRPTFENVMIGNGERPALSPPGAMSFRNESVRKLVGALFPPVLFWQSDFDRLRS